MYVVGYALQVDALIWQRLWENRIPRLFFSSMMLVSVVTLGSVILGTVLAYLIERTNLPLRHFFRPLLIAPLVTPCFIIAICYVNFFGMRGVGEKLLQSIGLQCELPNIYGFWGAAGIFIIGTYPYVYTIVLAALRRIDPSLSEAAKCLGVSRLQRLKRVKLPLLLPAISAGAILVALYVFSDFGVVNVVRYSTFVNMIYEQMSGRYDYSVACALSVVLIGITFVLVLSQQWLVKKREYTTVQNKTYDLPVADLKWSKWIALVLVVLILTAGLLLPVGVLIYWCIQSIGMNPASQIWQSSLSEVFRSGFNSLFLASLTATVAVALSLPLAYWVVRSPKSRMAKTLASLAQSGIALPGVLVALGLSLVFAHLWPKLNFSIFALFLAFLVHFFAKAFQMSQAGLRQVSKRLEEGSRLLGCSSIQSFWQVTRPLISPALFAAWIFVFLSSMRELPASLLLRPAGFDPLTVRVWIAASEGFYEQAALPALFIIIFSLPLVIMIARYQENYQTSYESD